VGHVLLSLSNSWERAILQITFYAPLDPNVV
jgi:hypothetical protein